MTQATGGEAIIHAKISREQKLTYILKYIAHYILKLFRHLEGSVLSTEALTWGLVLGR